MENIFELKKMQKIAGVITEGEYRMFIEATHDETLDEGIRSWLLGGLLTLTTLAGIGKVYQMDQQAKEDRAKQTEYYQNVLSKEVTKMSEDDLFNLGTDIADKTGELKHSSSQDINPEMYKKIAIRYAQDYIKAHPNKFAVGINGGIYQLGK